MNRPSSPPRLRTSVALADNFAIALSALVSNPTRSLLTILGVVIGVASVILLVSVGDGARTYLIEQFAGLGTHVLMVNPGRVRTMGLVGGAAAAGDNRLTLRDALALDRLCPSLGAVSGVVNGSGPVRYRGRTRNVMVLGVEEDYPAIRHIGADVGSFVTAEDVRSRRRVAVLGRTVAGELFGSENPLGKTVTIAGARVRVVGLIQQKGHSLGFDFDDLVFMPVSTAEEVFHQDGLGLIVTHAISGERAPRAVEEIKATLIRLHGDEDFTIVKQEAMLQTLGNIASMMTLFLTALGSISLLVGGVGIMNILLVSVSERTREIGLRMALGAHRGAILLQFLGEGMAISLLGGTAGIALGMGSALAIHRLEPSIPVQFNPVVIGIAFAFSAGVGVFFAIVPARKAASLDPIEALRQE